MRLFRLAVLVFFVGCISTYSSYAQDNKQLGSLTPIAGGLSYEERKFSIADHFYNSMLTNGKGAVYDIGGKYSTLAGAIGISDNHGDLRDQQYAIALDGKTVLSGRISGGDPAIPVHLDVTGVQAVRVTLDFYTIFADATLTNEPAPPALTAPKDQANVSGESVTLQWEPVDKAVSYGVQVLCNKLSKPSPVPPTRMWSINIDNGDSSCKFDLRTVPNGTYKWVVVAFGPSGVLGEFSSPRTFTVAR